MAKSGGDQDDVKVDKKEERRKKATSGKGGGGTQVRIGFFINPVPGKLR